MCPRQHLDETSRVASTVLSLKINVFASRGSATPWGVIHIGGVKKVIENPIKGPHSSSLIAHPIPRSLQTSCTELAPQGLFSSVYFAINKEKEPPSESWVQRGSKHLCYLDPPSAAPRRRRMPGPTGKDLC